MKRTMLKVACRECQVVFNLDVIDSDYMEWLKGAFVQDALPYLSESERELLISRTCGSCYDQIYLD